MNPRHVLFVGGIADGKWYSIGPEHTSYRIPLPQEVTDLVNPVSTTVFRTHDYRIERFVIFGLTVWVALFAELRSDDREAATIRTLFQRDVAGELLRGQA